jgi:hypothetical protein
MSDMYRQLLNLHWKTVRWPLAPVILLAFGLPLFVLRLADVFGPAGTRVPPAMVIHMQGEWSFVFPFLALITGVMIALTAWSWDHQGRHVYALSLPVSRGRYSMLKLAAGMTMLLLPVIALAVGTMAGLAATPVPTGLHAYPLSFVARFLLAATIVYAATFAAASSTVRTTAIILVLFVLVVIFGTVFVSFLQEALHDHSIVTPIELLYTALARWPGPFNVFGGNWLIIDA